MSSLIVSPTDGNTFDPKSRASVSRWVRANAEAIRSAAGTLSCDFPKGDMRLAGDSAKIEKGRAIGRTAVIYGAPHSSAFSSPRDGSTCLHSTPECRRNCLGTESGRMRMRPVGNSRLWKTTLRRGAPEAYYALLALDVMSNERAATRDGKPAYFRCDGSTDEGDGAFIADNFPRTQAYDYTKDAERAFDSLGTAHHITLSYTGRNRRECIEYLSLGGNVAVVTDLAKGDAKPLHWNGFPAVDGDEHDLRPLDGPGRVALLSWKGPRVGLDTAGPFVWRCRK